jgi:hypothetical protein
MPVHMSTYNRPQELLLNVKRRIDFSEFSSLKFHKEALKLLRTFPNLYCKKKKVKLSL